MAIKRRPRRDRVNYSDWRFSVLPWVRPDEHTIMTLAALALAVGFATPNCGLVSPASQLLRSHVGMQLSEGTKMENDCLLRAKISGKRTAIFFLPDATSAGSVDELGAISASAKDFEALDCQLLLAVQPGSSLAEWALPLVVDDPFDFQGSKQTLRRQFGVPQLQTSRGPMAARVTYVLDVAGVIRGVFASETDCAAHAAFALDALREMQAAPETEAEKEFNERSVVTGDGQRVALRPSAVGRMREKEAKARAEREAARSAGGKSAGWWPF